MLCITNKTEMLIYKLLAVSTRPPAGDLSRYGYALYCLGPAGLCQEFY